MISICFLDKDGSPERHLPVAFHFCRHCVSVPFSAIPNQRDLCAVGRQEALSRVASTSESCRSEQPDRVLGPCTLPLFPSPSCSFFIQRAVPSLSCCAWRLKFTSLCRSSPRGLDFSLLSPLHAWLISPADHPSADRLTTHARRGWREAWQQSVNTWFPICQRAAGCSQQMR